MSYAMQFSNQQHQQSSLSGNLMQPSYHHTNNQHPYHHQHQQHHHHHHQQHNQNDHLHLHPTNQNLVHKQHQHSHHSNHHNHSHHHHHQPTRLKQQLTNCAAQRAVASELAAKAAEASAAAALVKQQQQASFGKQQADLGGGSSSSNCGAGQYSPTMVIDSGVYSPTQLDQSQYSHAPTQQQQQPFETMDQVGGGGGFVTQPMEPDQGQAALSMAVAPLRPRVNSISATLRHQASGSPTSCSPTPFANRSMSFSSSTGGHQPARMPRQPGGGGGGGGPLVPPTTPTSLAASVDTGQPPAGLGSPAYCQVGAYSQLTSSASSSAADSPTPSLFARSPSLINSANSNNSTGYPNQTVSHHGQQPHYSSSSSTASPSGGPMSASDALSLGINLEQYISKRNERERSRVRNVNDAFDNLKNSLPLDIEKTTKRMSKVEILRTAISYIRELETVLGSKLDGEPAAGSQGQGQGQLVASGGANKPRENNYLHSPAAAAAGQLMDSSWIRSQATSRDTSNCENNNNNNNYQTNSSPYAPMAPQTLATTTPMVGPNERLPQQYHNLMNNNNQLNQDNIMRQESGGGSPPVAGRLEPFQLHQFDDDYHRQQHQDIGGRNYATKQATATTLNGAHY